MTNKTNKINAVDMVRKIRNKNYQITKTMTTAEKLAYIHKRASLANKHLSIVHK